MSATCRQRSVVEALERRSTPITVDQLVDEVAPTDNFSRTLERWCDIHEELHVVDLPVLDAIGVVEYDSETGLVSLPSPETDRSASVSREAPPVAQ